MSAATSRSPAPRFGPSATKQAKPHAYDPDLEVPGVCTCRLLKGHRLHDETAIREHLGQLDEAQAEARRRLGEVD